MKENGIEINKLSGYSTSIVIFDESELGSMSAESQAVFRLGQMDMRESIVNMLTEAADNTFGITRSVLRIAVDKIKAMEVLK